jgi:hypothetical protein
VRYSKEEGAYVAAATSAQKKRLEEILDPSQMMEHLTASVQTGAAKRVFTEELKDNLLAGKMTVDEAQTLLAVAFIEKAARQP